MLAWLSLIFASTIPLVLSTMGVDVSQKVSRQQLECLRDNGHRFVVVRAYRNNGVIDSSSARTIRNARAVGFNRVDAYLFPCIPCEDASQQVSETIEYLRDENVSIDTLWFVIDGTWYNDTDLNIRFLQDLILEVNNARMKYGIYTSSAQWWTIMNDATIFSSDSLLWYTDHDHETSFNGFQPFGGWQQPSMKQFISDVKECGVILGRNFS